MTLYLLQCLLLCSIEEEWYGYLNIK